VASSKPELFLLSDNDNGMTAMPVGVGLDGLAVLRGEVRPAEPIEFRQHLGQTPRDVMAGDAALLLISERLRTVLRDGGFSGWTTYPARLRDKTGAVIPGYHGLAVTGRSRRMRRPFLAELAKRGATELARATQSGDDIYLDGGSAAIVVTSHVADALRAAKVTNLHLLPVA
jgi:hypothetical protein